MSTKTSYIYLHGFASSPASSKAKFFAEHLQAEKANVAIPDLNGDDFQQLTLTSQLQIVDEQFVQIERSNSADQIVMVGSSMGGLLAALKSMRSKRVAALILMAPGFGLMKRWPDLFGANTLDDWKEQGVLNVYHHGFGDYRSLGYTFIEDAATYQTEDLKIEVPTILFHGRHDTTVPILESEEFHKRNLKLVEFHPLDDDHQLLASLDYIWERSNSFLKRLHLL